MVKIVQKLKKSNKTERGENSQYSVAKRGSVAGLPYQPVTNALLWFSVQLAKGCKCHHF